MGEIGREEVEQAKREVDLLELVGGWGWGGMGGVQLGLLQCH